LIDGALDLASHIAKMSPVAVSGTKHNLNYSRDHPVDESLEYIVSSFLLVLCVSQIYLMLIIGH
jgi:delta(3,5)-delta(2,4)-dienoyl-CoA isomerase